MAKSPSIIELNNRMIALEKELKELKADMAKGLKLATHKPREIPYSFEDFCKYLKDGDMPEPLAVGDYINFELITGEPMTAYVTGVMHDTKVDGSLANYTFGLTPLDGYYKMNEESDNSTSWENSKGRVAASRVFKLLPTCLQECIVKVKKLTSAGNKSTKIIKTEDALFLFSEVEVLGRTPYSANGEGKQYEFFKVIENIKKIFKRDSWLRSPHRDSSHSFCYVFDGGSADWYYADCYCALPFGFCA